MKMKVKQYVLIRVGHKATRETPELKLRKKTIGILDFYVSGPEYFSATKCNLSL